jgi:hypothetical protein
MNNYKLGAYFSENSHCLARKYCHIVTLACLLVCSALTYPAHAAIMDYEVVFNVKSTDYRPFPPGFEFDSFTTPRYFSSFPAVGDSFVAVDLSIDTAIPSGTDVIKRDDGSVLVKLEPIVFRAEVGGVAWNVDAGEAGFFGGTVPLPGDLPGFRIADNQVTGILGTLRKLGSGFFIDFSSDTFAVKVVNGRIVGDIIIKPAVVASPSTITLLLLGLGLACLMRYRQRKLVGRHIV